MPARLTGEGHDYGSQLAGGGTLKSQWNPDVPINGFDQQNADPKYRNPHEAVGSGDCNALVPHEMVEIENAIA